MKKDIHPAYFKEATAICACGHKYVFGSTQNKIEVEICSACHPFYTGKSKIIDSAGRVEKFKLRRAQKKPEVKKTPRKIKAEKSKLKTSK